MDFDPEEKEFVELVIDGMIMGTTAFVMLAFLFGAWRHPWMLLAAWATGSAYTLLINWLDKK